MPAKEYSSKALSMAHVAVFLMGMAGVLAGHSGFSPWRSTFYRVFIGALVLFMFWPIWKGKKSIPLKTVFLALLLGGLLGFHWFAFFKSIQLLGVTLGSALIGVEPLIVALFAFLILKEKMARKIRVAMFISSLGFLLLLSVAQSEHSQIYSGVFWSLGAFVLFAILVISNRKLVSTYSPTLITAIEMLGAVPVAWTFCGESLWPQGPREWVFALALGVFCTGLAYVLFNSSMKKLPAHYAGALLSMEVAYGMGAGWILGDHLGTIQVAAAFLISNILFFDLVSLFSGLRRK